MQLKYLAKVPIIGALVILAGLAVARQKATLSPDSDEIYRQDQAVRTKPFNLEAFGKTFKHQIAVCNGVRIHYVIGGKGEPIVLLHGWTQTWYEWRYVMAVLSDKYTVIAPDLRGFGDSDKPVSGYDQDNVAKDILELTTTLGFKHFNLVGHDVGAPVAYALAAANPDKVSRLAIVEGNIPGLGGDAAGGGSVQIWHPGFNSTPDLPEQLVTGRERIYLSYFYRNFAYDPTAISDADISEYMRTYSATGGLRGGFEYFRASGTNIQETKIAAKKGALEMPVLAVGGALAIGEGVAVSLRAGAKNVLGGVIAKSGHYLPEERPVYLSMLLRQFFEH